MRKRIFFAAFIFNEEKCDWEFIKIYNNLRELRKDLYERKITGYVVNSLVLPFPEDYVKKPTT